MLCSHERNYWHLHQDSLVRVLRDTSSIIQTNIMSAESVTPVLGYWNIRGVSITWWGLGLMVLL